MAEVMIAMTLASTAFSAVNQLQAGKAQQKAADHPADQARQAAGQERAAAQREAIEQRRQGGFIASRAQAVGAASGAGGAGLENILGDIGAEGEFRALSSMFMGEERARGLEMQADVKEFEGKEARRASRMGAITTALRGGAKAAGIGHDAGYFGSASTATGSPKNLLVKAPGLAHYGGAGPPTGWARRRLPGIY